MSEEKKAMLRSAGYNKEVDLVENGQCPICECIVDESLFVSETEKKEFEISGLCKDCQDKIFNEIDGDN